MSEVLRKFDERMMRLALEEAKKGRPSPNPHVGAVLVKGEQVIGTGHHEKVGMAHAEVVALTHAQDKVQGATLYVTFEPCNHVGRTGPCTEAILAAGIQRVVVGYRDPAPHVPGAVEKLRAAGVKVLTGVLEEEAKACVEDFSKHIRTGMPFVTLKAAVTLDGKLAARDGASKWITGEEARKAGHRLRDQSDAVLVGIGTVLADDPQLTVRHVEGQDPLRVVLDSHLRIPLHSQIVQHLTRLPMLVFTSAEAPLENEKRLRDKGVEIVRVPLRNKRLDLTQVMLELGQRSIVRLLVEGGAQVLSQFVQNELADELQLFMAPQLLGDAYAITWLGVDATRTLEDAWRLRFEEVQRVGPDILVRARFNSHDVVRHK